MSSPTTTIPTPNPTSADWSLYVDTQNFNVTGLDGNPMTLSLAAVNNFIYWLITQDAMYGFTIGATGILMIVLLILTTSQKARRPIFIFNFLSLLLLCLRETFWLATGCLEVGYGVGEYLIGGFAQYPKPIYAVPDIFSCIISMFLYAVIFTSLILQVRVVFSAEPRTQKIITVLLSLFALAIEALWIAFQSSQIAFVLNSTQTFVHVKPSVYNTVRICFVIFVGISCLLFLYKLFVTIRRRRAMGFRHFGPLQVLFIVFGQCLIVPRTSFFYLNLITL